MQNSLLPTPVHPLQKALLPILLTLAVPPLTTWAEGEQAPVNIELARGAYGARFYAPETPVLGCIVLGSGDGGWSYWEERVAKHLAKRGFGVAGVDFNAYADTDYDETILRRDFRALVAEVRTRFPQTQTLPVLYGGWSMGAEQSLPAAAEPAERAAGLRGLILVAPGARGRYGLRLRDRMAITPTGPGTFGLKETAPACADLRLAVFHAGLDPLDDLGWFEGQALDLRLWTVPRTLHDFAGAGDEFLAAMDEALVWLLKTPETDTIPSEKNSAP